jgi:hypothetical protein
MMERTKLRDLRDRRRKGSGFARAFKSSCKSVQLGRRSPSICKSLQVLERAIVSDDSVHESAVYAPAAMTQKRGSKAAFGT